MNAALNDALDAQLTFLDQDKSYDVVELLKETEWERTEKVRSAAGELFIRKYLIDEEGFGNQYRDLITVDNPALARVYNTYDIPGYQVVIMEYCSGPTLREWIDTLGTASPQQTASIICDLCTGLHALHHLNPPVIHRDVKPDNVIMTESGVKLIDFGIARRFEPQKAADTKTWGTMGYAAPEQMGFGQSDNRTDVYALGMLMYFLLTAHDPQSDIRHTIQNNTEIDEPLRSTIQRCVEMDPSNRFQSVEQLRTTLGSPSQKQSRNTIRSNESNRFGSLWIAWQAVGVMTIILFALVSIFLVADAFSYASTEDACLYTLSVLGINLFMIVPVCCLATNLGGWITRWSFLKTYRVGKLVALAVICLVLLFTTVGISASFLSDDFEQQRIAFQQK